MKKSTLALILAISLAVMGITALNSSGNPVNREAQALNDLAKTGKSTKFVPYKGACRATGNARCN